MRLVAFKSLMAKLAGISLIAVAFLVIGTLLFGFSQLSPEDKNLFIMVLLGLSTY